MTAVKRRRGSNGAAWCLAPVLLLAIPLARGAGDEPKLTLEAPRVQSLLPGLAAKGYGKRVDVRARLEGELPSPEDFYCLDELWDWGDGTTSLREEDCEPYEDGAEVTKDFAETHYFRPGSYAIALSLVHMEDTVIRGTIDIRIY